MIDLQQQFESYSKDEGLIKPQHRILLAISGGIDSVVLAHLLKRSSIYVELAHVNFQLRGEESDRDEKFVRSLSTSLQVPLHVKQVNAELFAAEHKLSIQEAARKIRYDWFQELLLERDLDRIATAHHADDTVETMFMNLFRGTGLTGLRGILPKQGKIIRPLLFATRQQIEEYAKEYVLSYVEDSSNASEKYTRNFLRLHLIPQVIKIWPEVAENLRENMIRFREAEQLYKEALEKRIKKLVINKGEELHVPVEGLRFSVPLKTLVFEIFHPRGFTSRQTDEIIQLMNASTGRFIDSATHRIIKNRNWFICTPLQFDKADLIFIDEQTSVVKTALGELVMHKENKLINDPIAQNSYSVQLDLSEMVYPLILRPWKAGDYFYPLGMPKKKKIARFLIDQKVPRHEKEKILVLESAGRICWILGHRIDERFKIHPSTTQILTLSLTKSAI
jgi:tRNA(Ile)-lysidine synthase